MALQRCTAFWGHRAPTIWANKKCPMDLRKLLTPFSLSKTKSTVKVGSWSAVEPPPGGPITVLFSAKNHNKVAFEEPVKRYSWRDTLTVSLVSLINSGSGGAKSPANTFVPDTLRTFWGSMVCRRCGSQKAYFRQPVDPVVRDPGSGIFWIHKWKAQRFWVNFGAFFVRKFVTQKESFVTTSLCRRAKLP